MQDLRVESVIQRRQVAVEGDQVHHKENVHELKVIGLVVVAMPLSRACRLLREIQATCSVLTAIKRRKGVKKRRKYAILVLA